MAREFDVALRTVQRWVARAKRQRLDRADLRDRPRGPRAPANRTPLGLERAVVALRRELRLGDLGECGAAAIRDRLLARGESPPTIRTIGRILERRGLVGLDRRVRRPPPPRAWYLPDAAGQVAEIDCFDVVEALAIKGGYQVEVLNAISVHGRLAASWPTHPTVRVGFVTASMIEHWRAFGLPRYAQFDNDMLFAGNHHKDVVGRVIGLCLSLGVTAVFTPAYEMGFQAQIERYNGLWQKLVWHRFKHPHFLALSVKSARFVAAHRARHRTTLDAALRRPFPGDWDPLAPCPRSGSVIFLRRTDAKGRASILGRTYSLTPDWPSRLVRAELNLDADQIAFYSLRRRDPSNQRLLKCVRYVLPRLPSDD